MPLQITSSQAISYLERFLTHNKARGMVAELALAPELHIAGTPAESKLLPGGWLISPKVDRPQYHRYLVSVMPDFYGSEHELQAAVAALEQNRGWQALATFMAQSAIGIIVSGAVSISAAPSLDSLRWKSFVYRSERLLSAHGDEPFVSWPGARGRAGTGTNWQTDVAARFRNAASHELTELALRQAFFYGYLKQQLKKPLEDPYDVDAFIVGFTGTVMPMIIGCRWNLQAGGAGMGGGATQTVMISGALFGDFSLANFSEEWLAQNRSLQGSVKRMASQLASNLSQYLSV